MLLDKSLTNKKKYNFNVWRRSKNEIAVLNHTTHTHRLTGIRSSERQWWLRKMLQSDDDVKKTRFLSDCNKIVYYMYLCRHTLTHTNGTQSDGRWWSLRTVDTMFEMGNRKRKSHTMKIRKLMWHSIKSDALSHFHFFFRSRHRALAHTTAACSSALKNPMLLNQPSFSHLYLPAHSHHSQQSVMC